MLRFPRRAALGAAAAALALFAPAPATAVAPPLSDPHIIAHFDKSLGQLPENLALEPDGSADLTFVGSRQIVRVTLAGDLTTLAQLPPTSAPVTPVIGIAAPTGIDRAHDGTLYFNYATGTAELQGVWRLVPGGTPERIAALPPNGLPNGLALDEHAGVIYSADSVLGTVWRIPLAGGTATAWATGPELLPTTFIGANGLKVHHGAVWVSNSDQGTLLRIPLCDGGSPGPVSVRASGLPGIDDFAFTGHGDTVLAAINPSSELALVTPDGDHHIVLTAADGLSNPSAVALRGRTVYVTSPAFNTADPNLLLARITRYDRTDGSDS
ncbi:hypothetical protein [Kitasatospora sp. NPDC050543]|uniref:hypothetical protein n=1 Tax=Kitasatospora sp. NPDC050543 TaxID=3364054 RepID=UPI0037A829BB